MEEDCLLGRLPLEEAGERLAAEIVHYVARTLETVSLGNAAESGPFAASPYVRSRRVRSVLCLPVLRGGRCMGALYLENNLATDCFTPERVALLGMLAAQTAISLENARMYAELEEMVSRRTAELAESNARFEAFMDHLPALVFIKDKDGKTVYVNRGFEERMGTGWLGRTVRDRFPEEIARAMREDDRLGMLGVRQREERLTGIDGKECIYRTTKFPIRHPGKPALLGGFAIDVTESKRAEEERLRLDRDLQQAQKAESLGRMAGALAHHFNNILMGIMGNQELALDRLPLESDARANIIEAMNVSRKAAEISRFMLTYVGQTAGKKEQIDLSEASREAALLLNASLPGKVRLRVEAASQGPVVLADGAHLKKVLSNLILNAVEAIGDRDGEITVGIREMIAGEIPRLRFFPSDWEPGKNRYACLSVSDTGSGMDRETLEKIFDPFFSTRDTGRGLGLPVALGLVRGYEGPVSVESRPGRGAVFQVFLPVSDPEQARSPAETASVSGVIPRERRVLLAEDEPMVRRMTESMLQRLGCNVVSACDGVEAVEIFRSRKDEFDLVLLDLNMPRMNGWQTLAALREMQPDIPVVLASGYDEAQVMQAGHPEKPPVFLQKPYHLKDLEAAIIRISRALAERPGQSSSKSDP